MKKIAIVLLGLASMWSVSAFAVSQQSGVVLGVNTGWSAPDSKPSLPGYSTQNQNYTLGGSVGYNYAINKNIGAGFEANYSDFGKTNYSGSTASGSFANSALQLLLTGTYLMDNGFNTFVKVGAANEQTSLNIGNSEAGKTSWIPAAAAGLGYEVMQNLNVYGQYERTFGDNWNNATTSSSPSTANSLNIFSIGVNYTLPM